MSDKIKRRIIQSNLFCFRSSRCMIYDVEQLKKIEYFANMNLTYAFDSLTQVLRREIMSGYIKWLIEKKKKFSYWIVDVDNFKNVNDTYGHHAGDTVLCGVAAYIAESVKDKGLVGRYGGDEFMVVMENIVDYDEVWSYAHKINAGIGGVRFDGQQGLSITISIGIARFPKDAQSFDELCLIADKALYRGKIKGRNCFIIYLTQKHANIDISKERSKTFSAMHLCTQVYEYLTAYPDVENAIGVLFRFLASRFMFDHLCIESEKQMNFEVTHALAKNKEFTHIPLSYIDTVISALGYTSISKTKNLDRKECGGLYAALNEQNIVSVMYCKISAFGKNYGYVRVDMTDTVRIWQDKEIVIMITVANTIGLLLHYQNKELDDFRLTDVDMIGDKREK